VGRRAVLDAVNENIRGEPKISLSRHSELVARLIIRLFNDTIPTVSEGVTKTQ